MIDTLTTKSIEEAPRLVKLKQLRRSINGDNQRTLGSKNILQLFLINHTKTDVIADSCDDFGGVVSALLRIGRYIRIGDVVHGAFIEDVKEGGGDFTSITAVISIIIV